MNLETLGIQVGRSENLPVLPTFVVQIIKLFEDPNVSPRSLENIIEQDPALTAKILRVASSPLYGAHAANSIGRALSVLGLNTLRSIAISLAYQQVLSGGNTGIKYDRLAFWRHSLATAVAAKEVIKLSDVTRADEVYIAGLTHDVGVLVFERFLPSQLERAILTAQRTAVSLSQAELNVIGCTHSEAGAMLAEKWHMSKMIQCAINFHENPAADKEYYSTTAAVAIGNAIAYLCDFPAFAGVPGSASHQDLLEELSVSEEVVADICERVKVHVSNADQMYGSTRPAA